MSVQGLVNQLLEADFDPKAELMRMSRTPGFGRPKPESIDDFTWAYIECALWSSNDSGAYLEENVVQTAELAGKEPDGDYMSLGADTEEAIRQVWKDQHYEDGVYYVLWDDADIYEGPKYSIYCTRNHNDRPLDENYGFEDIADRTLIRMVQDCKEFQAQNAELLATGTDSKGGHDFWLTRNGHGAGFWDGGWEEAGEALSDAAKEYGEVNLYASGGKIYD